MNMSDSDKKTPKTFGKDSSKYIKEFNVYTRKVLVALDGKKSAKEIADTTGFTLIRIQKILNKLKQLGLVESSFPNVSVLSTNDVGLIVHKLTHIVGPVAEALVEGVVADIGYKPSEYPTGYLDLLIDKLSQEINDDMRQEFQESIRSSIKINETQVVQPFSNVSVLSSKDIGLIVQKLTRIVGPVAEALVEDVAVDIGYKQSEYPVGRLDLLIDKLSQEIEEDDRRQEFQESIRSSIKVNKKCYTKRNANFKVELKVFAKSVWSLNNDRK